MNREEAYSRIDAIIAKYEIDEEYVTITSTLDYDALRIARKALEQEPCKNAIGREDMLDAIGHGTTYTSEELQKIIKALPPVNSQPKWIPVSERLPETNDDVLVTDGVDMFVAWYSRKGMWQGWMSSDNNFERNTPIDAWMPLPPCYEPQERSE